MLAGTSEPRRHRVTSTRSHRVFVSDKIYVSTTVQFRSNTQCTLERYITVYNWKRIHKIQILKLISNMNCITFGPESVPRTLVEHYCCRNYASSHLESMRAVRLLFFCAIGFGIAFVATKKQYRQSTAFFSSGGTQSSSSTARTTTLHSITELQSYFRLNTGHTHRSNLDHRTTIDALMHLHFSDRTLFA